MPEVEAVMRSRHGTAALVAVRRGGRVAANAPIYLFNGRVATPAF